MRLLIILSHEFCQRPTLLQSHAFISARLGRLLLLRLKNRLDRPVFGSYQTVYLFLVCLFFSSIKIASHFPLKIIGMEPCSPPIGMASVELAWDACGIFWVYNYSHTPAIYFLDIAQKFDSPCLPSFFSSSPVAALLSQRLLPTTGISPG